jgi:hypothetical protein
MLIGILGDERLKPLAEEIETTLTAALHKSCQIE